MSEGLKMKLRYMRRYKRFKGKDVHQRKHQSPVVHDNAVLVQPIEHAYFHVNNL